ncbi:tetraacyldisaccharide 4'-kinase [Methylophaga sp.]|jgi:tetraacyldisaccharide 4'-kinase|uniref:tetraacyldisaccharide 4'-kinase n=1 Tax=Methylophaga sp. TaxID=2024840 RepID=UPI0013FE737F|nr:tetraacyldisaccharide 4'-kinase [Methylophaga sp.]MTI63187.1 tetraacyldisaccharide 4'-kinase [Methylophaga sp.]
MQWLSNSWYRLHPVRWLLLPLSLLYRLIVAARRTAYQRGWLTRHKMRVPVIVVGNISVGGTGKTPFVLWLCDQLKQAGFKPGIISRGYGGKARHYPLDVTAQTTTAEAGDEPVLIARRSGCPVVVDPDRSRAAVHLLSQQACDVIISDDGLQHYALERDIEICLVDSQRRFGNKLCLPAGPLREPVSRLQSVNFVVYNGEAASQRYQMQLEASHWIKLTDPEQQLPLSAFQAQEVHAVAGIGHPQRFFDLLCEHEIIVHPHAFDDHHDFSAGDLDFGDELPVLMTEKDAVKCQAFAHPHHWYLPVTARIDDSLAQAIVNKLKDPTDG